MNPVSAWPGPQAGKSPAPQVPVFGTERPGSRVVGVGGCAYTLPREEQAQGVGEAPVQLVFQPSRQRPSGVYLLSQSSAESHNTLQSAVTCTPERAGAKSVF